MSKETVETVISKAILDAEFRLLLFEHPDQALDVFGLTPTEKTKLKSVDSETLDALANTLNQRLGGIKRIG